MNQVQPIRLHFLPGPACLAIAALLAATAYADEPPVKFDVPALIGASTVTLDPNASPQLVAPLADEKIVQITIPVTSEVQRTRRGQVVEFRFNVHWNQFSHPLEDFAPKTQTVSDINGVIAIEKNEELNRGIGLSLTGKYESLVNGNINGEIGSRNATKTRYEETPQHEVLVASGSSHRGTGAFFRFHRSRKETLEGSRNLTLQFRVPRDWRGGVLKVECHATGEKTILGDWKESFEFGRVFVLPIYISGDQQARDAAVNLVRSEQGLRQTWRSTQQDRKPAKRNLLELISIGSAEDQELPDQWLHYLIQSGQDDYLETFRSRLPSSLAQAADQFVAARQQLLGLNR